MSGVIIIGDPRHNHSKKLEALLKLGRVDAGIGLSEMLIKHDDWCAFLQDDNGICNCDPDFYLNGKKI